jgi:hypothetical protein
MQVIESDFDTEAFLIWRRAAVKWLSEIVDPEFEFFCYMLGEADSRSKVGDTVAR